MEPETSCFNEHTYKHNKPTLFFISNNINESRVKGLCYYCYRTLYVRYGKTNGQFYDTYKDAQIALVARNLFGVHHESKRRPDQNEDNSN